MSRLVIKQKFRAEMISSIRGYNRHLTVEVLKNMNWMALLRNCHPIERNDFARRLKNEGIISEQDIKKLNAPYVQKKSRKELYGYGEGKEERS